MWPDAGDRGGSADPSPRLVEVLERLSGTAGPADPRSRPLRCGQELEGRRAKGNALRPSLRVGETQTPTPEVHVFPAQPEDLALAAASEQQKADCEDRSP